MRGGDVLRKPTLLPILIPLILTFSSCSEDVHYNPFDPENIRTAGGLPELELIPGDGEIVIRWKALPLEGVKSYRIYRAFTGDPEIKFQMIAEIPAEEGREVYEYADTGLENDPMRDGERLFYIYRISYVDAEGKEVPDPTLPLEPEYEEGMEELPVFWRYAKASPSIPPPPVEVKLGQPQDLRVILIWSDYVPPEDVVGYRVYAAEVKEVGEVPAEMSLVYELMAEELEPLRPEQFYFVDTAFKRDKVLKAYKVVAVDRFGVESRSELFYAESPNLPPKPPVITNVRFIDKFPKYDVIITWKSHGEPDLAGFRIYSRPPGGIWEPKVTINDPFETRYKVQGEDYVITPDGFLAHKEYAVTAFDNTPKEDGTYDESPLPP